MSSQWRATPAPAGGRPDDATALRVATATLPEPLPSAELHALAATLGTDVPFFLADGPQLGTGDGTELAPLDVPQDFWILLVLPHDAAKHSTASVYTDFDARDGAAGLGQPPAALHDALAQLRRPRDLAALPANDLASSPLTGELRTLGAFRADVSGAGPAVYGLFPPKPASQAALRAR